jgi:hypothetical protein
LGLVGGEFLLADQFPCQVLAVLGLLLGNFLATAMRVQYMLSQNACHTVRWQPFPFRPTNPADVTPI